jgi:hypothetical protein
MKYLKMILVPIVAVVIAMLLFWMIATTETWLQALAVAMLIPIVAGLLLWEFVGLKTTADKLIAVAILVVIGGAIKFLSIWIYNWPWVVTIIPNPYPDAGILAPVFRFFLAVTNWWCLGGLLVGCAIFVFIAVWLIKTKKI